MVEGLSLLGIILVILLVIEWCRKMVSIEGLRLQSSHDIRGDPLIPFQTGISPWNVTSNLPYRNREMVMESTGLDIYPYNYGFNEKMRGGGNNNLIGIPIGIVLFPLLIWFLS